MAKYRFEEFAINCTEKRIPAKEDYATYIGLEHMDTKNIHIARWGSEVPIIGEKLVMHKGDILFGKRNTYLRRAAIAPHDGIFSAHGMILRPKEDIVDYDFFALFIASDYFFDKAIQISVGSLSPTVNWKDLKDLEFNLPDIKTQKELAKVLWSINDTLDSYKEQLRLCDELVKAQFVEMFGGNAKFENVKIKDCFNLQMGKTPARNIEKFWNANDYKWITINDMGKYDKYTQDTAEYISEEAVKKTGIKIVPENTVIMSFKLSIGKIAITSENIYTNEAIMAFIPYDKNININ